MEEVRWELDIRGYDHVKIFISGGIDENKILEYNSVADAYGVGTHISNSPVVDYSMDIVEVDGKPLAKRGKESGLKQLWVCHGCGSRMQTLEKEGVEACAGCGGTMEGFLKESYKEGRKLVTTPPPRDIRSFVLGQLATVEI
jgi:nicotinate phosphoribosyltransferase